MLYIHVMNLLTLQRLVGDIVLATAFISYAGPFNQEFRGRLTENWREIVELKEIPASDNEVNIATTLVDPPTVANLLIYVEDICNILYALLLSKDC